MPLRSHSFASGGAFAACVILTLVTLATEAQARPEVLRWTHSRSDVQRFDALVRDANGSNPNVISLGVPSRNSNGEYTTEIDVEGDVLVSLRAIGPNSSTDVSNWTSPRFFAGAPGETPTPPPTPPPTTTVPVNGGTPLTPTPGAAARFDFSGGSAGPNISGWVDTRRDYSLSVDDALFDRVNLGSNAVLHTASTDSHIHAHVTGLGGPWSNFELRGRMAVDEPAASVGVTTYSGYPGSDAYYRLGRTANGNFRLEARHGLSCSSIDSGVGSAMAGRWVRFEFDVEDGASSNRIRAKVWYADAAEPAGPQIDCVDNSPNRPRQGTIGAWSAGDGQKYWDDFEIIQGVAPAPTPPPQPPLLLQIIPVIQ